MTQDDISKFIIQLDQFAGIDAKMPVSTILSLMHVAQAEQHGKPIMPQDLQAALGVPSSATSRSIHYWADGHKDIPGLETGKQFVAIQSNRGEQRFESISLTPAGKSFIDNI